jgi:hypothetical protein
MIIKDRFTDRVILYILARLIYRGRELGSTMKNTNTKIDCTTSGTSLVPLGEMRKLQFETANCPIGTSKIESRNLNLVK